MERFLGGWFRLQVIQALGTAHANLGDMEVHGNDLDIPRIFSGLKPPLFAGVLPPIPALLNFCLSIDHMLTRHGVIFFNLELIGHGTFVLVGRIEVSCISRGVHSNLFSHSTTLTVFLHDRESLLESPLYHAYRLFASL